MDGATERAGRHLSNRAEVSSRVAGPPKQSLDGAPLGVQMIPMAMDPDLPPENRTGLSMILYCGKGREMTQNKFSEAVMIGALKQLEAGRRAEDVGREVGVSKHTIYAWKAKYGGVTVSEAQEARQLRDENTRLKKLVVDLSLDKEMLKALIAKNGWSS